MMQLVKSYYNLTKPGIIYGNVLATVATFLLAANGHVNILLFLATTLGTALIIGSSCVFNNYIDRGIDKKMKRTSKRALVVGSIPVKNALIFGLILGILGFATLILFTNWLVVAAGVIGMFFYLTIYTTEKRRSPLGTLVGAIPGAMPPVAGFVAVTGRVDMGAVILFLMWVFWQLPHFWAIGVYRLKDYSEANLPILPVKRGVAETKKYMLGCMFAFLILSLGLTYFKYTGIVWLVAMIILGGRWIMLGLSGFKTDDDIKWGKKVFGFSLVIMLSMCLLMALNVVLP
jgi:protoheme IX farnesyltransferase